MVAPLDASPSMTAQYVVLVETQPQDAAVLKRQMEYVPCAASGMGSNCTTASGHRDSAGCSPRSPGCDDHNANARHRGSSVPRHLRHMPNTRDKDRTLQCVERVPTLPVQVQALRRGRCQAC